MVLGGLLGQGAPAHAAAAVQIDSRPDLWLVKNAAQIERELETEEADATERDPVLLTVLLATQTVALVGSISAGLLANKRGQELKNAVEKLRLVNESLRAAEKETRKQAAAARAAEKLAESTAETCTLEPPAAMLEIVTDPLQQKLRTARELLSDGEPQVALAMFREVQAATHAANDRLSERKALRGCAAAKQRSGDVIGAVQDLLEVLRLSQELGETDGTKETLGRVADLYAELNEFDLAGTYYDKYLADAGSERGL